MGSNNERVSRAKELEIVAMIARGDSQVKIAEAVGVSRTTVQNIQNRNKDALAVINQQLVEAKAESATRILKKSHQLIEQKLDEAITYDEQRKKIFEEYEQSDKEEGDLEVMKDKLHKLRDVTLTEVTSVAREMFNQSQVESGAAPVDPAQSKQAIQDIVELIKAGDTVALERIVFNP